MRKLIPEVIYEFSTKSKTRDNLKAILYNDKGFIHDVFEVTGKDHNIMEKKASNYFFRKHDLVAINVTRTIKEIG